VNDKRISPIIAAVLDIEQRLECLHDEHRGLDMRPFLIELSGAVRSLAEVVRDLDDVALKLARGWKP